MNSQHVQAQLVDDLPDIHQLTASPTTQLSQDGQGSWVDEPEGWYTNLSLQCWSDTPIRAQYRTKGRVMVIFTLLGHMSIPGSHPAHRQTAYHQTPPQHQFKEVCQCSMTS
jgi:hypothetical protein